MWGTSKGGEGGLMGDKSPLVGFDFTWSKEYAPMKKEEVMMKLQKWCKKWVFQDEEGDTGYKHYMYQGRVHVIKKEKTERAGSGNKGRVIPLDPLEYNFRRGTHRTGLQLCQCVCVTRQLTEEAVPAV